MADTTYEVNGFKVPLKNVTDKQLRHMINCGTEAERHIAKQERDRRADEKA